MEGMVLIYIHPSSSEMSLRPSKYVWAYGWHFLDSWLIQTVLTESLTLLQMPSPLPPTPPPSHLPTLLYVPLMILQWL